MRKIVVSIIVAILILIIFITSKIFFKKDNKKINLGNNKNVEEIEQYLLNIDSYKASIDATIISNKNENQYVMVQEVNKNYAKQVVKSPENIANMEITYENGTLQIRNTDLNVSKVYNDYPYVSNNILFFTDFLKTYKESENKSIEELEDAIYMIVNNKSNQYNQNQILRVNKQTSKPESLEIKDMNNQTKVYILYNEIELNI